MSKYDSNIQKTSDQTKKNPEEKIKIDGTPNGTIELHNSAYNRTIKDLYKFAKRGQTIYTGYLKESIARNLRVQGLKVEKSNSKKRGNFSGNYYYEVSWENAFNNSGDINLDKIPIEKCNLAQLLFITAYRAKKMQKSTEENNASESKDNKSQAEKGTILVIEDKEQGKLGRFKDVLIRDNYSILSVETLGEAIKTIEKMKKSNFDTLDGLILDFSFPVGEVDNKEYDSSKTINGRQCGIEFLRKYYHLFNNNRIPLVINTTASEELKREKLKEIGIDIREGEFGLIPQKFLQFTQIFNVDNESNSLFNPSGETIKDILKIFNERTENRRVQSKIQPGRSWNTRGEFIRDNSGNIIGYK